MSRLVFITGASSGIGQALAMRFYSAGYRLALAARRTAEVQAWAEASKLSAGRYQIYGADVADTDSIVAAGLACIAAQGVPDVVIANAGISIGMMLANAPVVWLGERVTRLVPLRAVHIVSALIFAGLALAALLLA